MAELQFDESKLSTEELALYRSMVERRKRQGADFGGPYAALMNHPQLCAKIEDLGYYLKFDGHLPRNIYQFVVLCVAKHTNSEFEWVDHVKHAEAAGVPKQIIASVKELGIASATFEEPYNSVARLLSATLTWRNIPPVLQNNCIERFGPKGFIELVVLSGFYQMFSAINQGFDVSLPAGMASPFK